MKEKLTIKQETFCQEYVKCGDATASYRAAFNCVNMKTTTITRRAFDLIRIPKVKARIEQLKDELKQAADIERSRIIYDLEAILDADISDYVELVTIDVPIPRTAEEIEAGIPMSFNQEQRLMFKDFSKLSQRQLRAIESIKHGKHGIEIKLHGKSWAIKTINEMCGYETPIRHELTGKDGNEIEHNVAVEDHHVYFHSFKGDKDA